MSERESHEFFTPFAHWREKSNRMERERDEAREALLKVLPYMRVDTPNACAAFDNARAILAKVKP